MLALPWNKYPIGLLSDNPKYVNPTCKRFEAITHVIHIENDIAILKRGTINPQLVYDESILNKERILVNWLSPNWWAPGFRYGNVSFEFDFEKMLEGCNVYWVEAMTKYNPTALRYLITKQDRSSDKRLIPFDPIESGGPWRYDLFNSCHTRNGELTIEFMFEEELKSSEALAIDFEKHHEKYCCIDAKTCRDKNMDGRKAAAIFSMGAIINEIDCAELPFSDSAIDLIATAYDAIFAKAEKLKFQQISYQGGTLAALGKAWMSAGYHRNNTEANAIASLFPNHDSFCDTVKSLLDECFPNDVIEKIGED